MKNHNCTGKYDILGLGHRLNGLTLLSGNNLGAVIRVGDTLTITHHDDQIAKYEVQKVVSPGTTNADSMWAVEAMFVSYVETAAG